MEITLNGEKHTLKGDGNVLDLLKSLGIDPEKVAVELDRQIVRAPQWGSTLVKDGAQVEIVHFVGGG
jgi:thiamine biosynthesis protein ThiS